MATPEELEPAAARARSEAQSAFGDGRVYLEKALVGARHIEIQVLADAHGHAVHLFERECSLQRRHQKIVEESPSPAVSPELRERMGALGVALARQVGYVNAGTLEFLVDADGAPYFLEMNTRLQVEHPVTEWVTGLDLVKLQIRIASGEPLPFTQGDIHLRGHAIECRIYAEDADHGFLPSPGKIVALRVPGGPGVRDDSGVYEGYEVPIHYDPLLSKLSVIGGDRVEAQARLRRALAEYRVLGIATNISFLERLLAHPDVVAGRFDTTFVERRFVPEAGGATATPDPRWEIAVAAAAVSAYEARRAGRPADEHRRASAWTRAGRDEQHRGRL